MLNRKASKAGNGADNHGRSAQRIVSNEARPPRRRFIISSKAAGRAEPPAQEGRSALKKPHAPGAAKPETPTAQPAGPAVPGAIVDLAETIKTLLHLAHENGHITYDDINDVLPEGLSLDDLDELYTKLPGLGVEIVDHAEVERANPAEPEEEEDSP